MRSRWRSRPIAVALGVVGALLVGSGCYGLPTVPSSVTGLAATSTSTSVTLSWSNPSFMWGVRIYRAEGLTPPSVPGLGSAPGNYHADVGDQASYTDTGLTTGATYTYAVVVYGADGYYSSPAAITVRPGAVSPPATFAAPVDHVAGLSNQAVALGDLNGDLVLDMVVADIRADAVRVLRGDGSGGFSLPGTPLATLDEPFSVALADLDLDGALDLVVTHSNSHLLSVRLGNGTGGFGSSLELDTGMLSGYSVAIGDLNGDTFPDLAVAGGEHEPFGVSVLLGDGDGGFGSATPFPTGEWPSSVAMGDLNGDAALDLVVTNAGANTLSVLLGDGAGGFAPASHFATGSEPTSVALADLDGDLHLDAVVTNAASNDVSVLLGDGAGGLAPRTDVAAGTIPTDVVVGDLNGDLVPDLAVANHGFATPSGVSVLLGNGMGGFDVATFYATGVSGTWSVAVGDLNADDRADLVVANSEGNGLKVSNGVSVLLNTTG